MTHVHRRSGLIIAIDGPSGAGKSTLTRHLAARLGYIHIDTGAMYRAVSLAVKNAGVDSDDDVAIKAICDNFHMNFQRTNGCCRVVANGIDVTEEIRTPEISLLTSKISSRKVVRDVMLRLQREMGCEGGVILEGRDIGTVVFPDAEMKFFLSASPEKRGQRRYLELVEKGLSVTLADTIAEVIQRDRQDEEREHAPLRKADDAIEIDSTEMSIEDVLEEMLRIINERLAAGEPGAKSA